MNGRIFDIEEFAVYDGPGIRCVIFFKGCPLRCMWCHNPEGLDLAPTRITRISLCESCGACDKICRHPEKCIGCGDCASVCPKGLIRISGLETSAEAVAARILKNAEILRMNGGGVTFSGGEPLMQPDFLIDIRKRLLGLHAAIETSGYAEKSVFERVLRHIDYVIMDLKMIDPALHRRYTGADNRIILENLKALKASSIPFRIRIPLIPGVNDSDENLLETAKLLTDAPNLEFIELLPYHKAAGGKYRSVRKTYSPDFDENAVPNANTAIFHSLGLEAKVL